MVSAFWFAVCMAALAVSDTIAILVEAEAWFFWNGYSAHMTRLICGEIGFLGLIAQNCSAWILVAMTFERYIVVCKPTTHNNIRTLSTIWKALVGILVVCILKNLHHFFTVNCSFSPESHILFCGIGTQNLVMERAVLIMELAFSSFVPSILIICINSIIINTRVSYRRNMKSRLRNNCNRRCSKYSRRDMYNKHGITLMLILVSYTFVVLTAPIFVNRLTFVFVPRPIGINAVALYYALNCIFGILFILNNCVNFYLYVITGHSFRQDLKEIFICKRFPPKTSCISWCVCRACCISLNHSLKRVASRQLIWNSKSSSYDMNNDSTGNETGLTDSDICCSSFSSISSISYIS